MDNNNEKSILLTESNIVDIYKKLLGVGEITKEEHEVILKRFYELVNHHI